MAQKTFNRDSALTYAYNQDGLGGIVIGTTARLNEI
jgi:hypothetical protein